MAVLKNKEIICQNPIMTKFISQELTVKIFTIGALFRIQTDLFSQYKTA